MPNISEDRIRSELEKLRTVLDNENYQNYSCTLTKIVKDLSPIKNKGDIWIECKDYYGKNTSLTIPLFTFEDEPFPRICFHKHMPDGIFLGQCFSLDPID